MTSPRTFYEVLDIPPEASQDDVESGYQRALDAFSDDALVGYTLFTADEAANFRQEVETAYRVLRDARTRDQYDDELARAKDKAQATLSFTARVVHAGDDSPSLSDVNVQTIRPANAPPAPRTAAPLHIAIAVEDAAPQTVPPAPKEPAPPVSSPALPPVSAVPTVSVPTLPPVAAAAPPPEPASTPTPAPAPAPAAPKYRRVRLDDDTTALKVARPTRAVTQPPMPAATHTSVDLQLPAEGEINGSVLQRLREACGMTVREMSDITKISVHYIKAMEANAFGELPGRVYLRGFVIHYARALGVDSERLARGYLLFSQRFTNQER